jgi:hypothetical protein
MCAAGPKYTTLPGKCPSCGDTVFLHVDGTGQTVLLDELGPRRRVHPCARRREDASLPLPGTCVGAAERAPDLNREIRRFEIKAAGHGEIERVGHVRDVHHGRSLATLARPATLEYERLFEALPSARFTQFVLVDPTPLSYTLWIPSGMGEVRQGMLIRARFRAHHVFGRSFLAVKGIGRPDLSQMNGRPSPRNG